MADQISKTRIQAPAFVTVGENNVANHTKRITLTSAQVTTLHTVPVSLLPAPGVGYANIFHWALIQFVYHTTQYTGGGVVAPVYHGATVDLTVAGGVAAATIQAAVSDNQLISAVPAAGGLAITANAGIDLYAASADFAAGDGTIVVILSYSIVKLG